MSILAPNNTTWPPFQVTGPFHYGQFQTFTNVNDHYSNIYEPWQPTPVFPLLEEAELLTSSTGLDHSGNTTYVVGNALPQRGDTIYEVGNAFSQPGNTIFDVGNAVPQFENTSYGVGNAVPLTGITTNDAGNAVPHSGNTIYGVGNAVPQSYMPLLSQSIFLGLPIDATDEEFSIAPSHPTSVNEILHHDRTSPLGLHGPIQHMEPNTCQECTQSFPSTAELERHAKRLYHDAFKCKCGKHYARLDNLKRHWDQTPKFPCPHCSKYTGVKAFIREDHLTQHLQTYHRHSSTSILGGNQRDSIAPITTDTAVSPTNITSTSTMPLVCTVSECTHYQHSFKIKSQYTDHMRRIHNHSPFLCLVQGCNKIGGKGYFRERDLFKHSQQVHYSVDN